MKDFGSHRLFKAHSIQKAELLHEDGFVRFRYANIRLHWNNWEFDEDTLETGIRFTIYWIWDHIEFDRTKWRGSLLHATGRGLDFFSAYKLGGLASDLVVAGYYRNEFRVRDLNLLKFQQEVSFAEDRVLSLFADFANFTEIELPFRKKSSSNNTIAGVGIGFRYGMRNLGGLPLIFTFGEGINVSQASREAHRREFMLVVAAGFWRCNPANEFTIYRNFTCLDFMIFVDLLSGKSKVKNNFGTLIIKPKGLCLITKSREHPRSLEKLIKIPDTSSWIHWSRIQKRRNYFEYSMKKEFTLPSDVFWTDGLLLSRIWFLDFVHFEQKKKT